MKRFLLRLTACAVLTTPLTGCLQDETGSYSGSGTSSTVDIPSNDEIAAGIFEALNLDYPGLETVKTNYENGQYYMAAKALLEYYRTRTDVSDTEVNLLSPSITEAQQKIADWASSANSYRLYVEGYSDPKADEADTPYSYKGSGDDLIDWSKNPSNEEEENYRLHRLAWMVPQGLAYRTSRSETYVVDQIAVFSDWVKKNPLSAAQADGDSADGETASSARYAWRNADVAERLQTLCSSMLYTMQSVNFTPEYAALFLSSVAEQADYLQRNLSEDEQSLKTEAGAVRRVGLLFPEMKDASLWATGAAEELNKGIDPKWFEAVNLDFSAFAKAKSAYAEGDYYGAAEAIFSYYRDRSNVVNPNVDLANTSVTAAEQSYADQALKENGYRFYVNGFLEDAANYIPYSFMTDDGGIDWMYMPTSSTQQELRYQLQRHQWMLPQAKAYYLSKNEKYAENWMEVFSDWFEQNPKPEVDLDYTVYPDNQAAEYRRAGWTWRPLDVAARVIDECSIWEYYKESSTITSTFFLKFLYYFAQQADHIMANYSADSNHLITQAQSVAFAGVLMPELKNASAWAASGTGVLNSTIESEYYDDGWLKDGDFSYHISSIEDFRSTMELVQANGRTDCISEANIETIHKMTHVVLHMTYPDYSAVNMEDTRNASWTKSVLKRNFTRYTTLFPEDEALLWMATERAQGAIPAEFDMEGQTFEGSGRYGVAFEQGGYYVLRTGWEASDMMMVFHNAVFSPEEQWHTQWDNGTFEFYVKGRQFFPDSGCYTYTTGSNRTKYAATAAHNTVTLDGKTISSCRGKLVRLDYNKTTGADRLVFWNPSYENLSHRRLVYLVDDSFVILVDEVWGDAAGTVNLNFHLADETKNGEGVVLDAAEMGFHTTFSDGNNLMARTFAFLEASKATAVTPTFTEKEGFVSYTTDSSNPRKAYSIDVEKTADANVRFITVLYPATDSSHTIEAATSGVFTDARSSVKVTIDGTEYTMTNTSMDTLM